MDTKELCLESELTKYQADESIELCLVSDLTKHLAEESIELCLESESTKCPVKRNPLQIRM